MIAITSIFFVLICGLIVANIFGVIDSYVNEMYKWTIGFIMWILILIAVAGAFVITFWE
jgi:hypothetical protein